MSNDHPKFAHEIFLDRTHGKRMSELLRRVGFSIHHIFEVYPGTTHETVADPEWIKLCSEKGWIAISGDKRLETVPENRQAIIDAKLKVFLLTDSNSLPEIWASAVIIGRYRMAEIIDGNEGPFFVNIGKRSDNHVARLRLPPGYVPPDPPDALPEPSQTLSLTSPEAEAPNISASEPKPLEGQLFE